MSQAQETLAVVIPVYNEQECLPELFSRLEALVAAAKSVRTEIVFVNDGSSDASRQMLMAFVKKHPFVRLINLSRNFGHQIAMTAGLDNVDADYTAIIDADLQDPPELITDFLRTMKERGADVVYGRRTSRKGETFFKKITATLFYRLIRHLCRVDIPADTGDFRLLSRAALSAFKLLREQHRFVRGMIPWIGFASVPFDYERAERHAGATKYPFRKMAEFALNAVFSFSNAPLRLAIYTGSLLMLLCFCGGAFLLYLRFFTRFTVPGITATILTVIMMGGIQVFMLGIIGEYIGRIFEEAKQRPLYIIKEIVDFQTSGTGHEPCGKK